jgi:hypothetical protein
MQTLEQWKAYRDSALQGAKKKPAMYLGPKDEEHLTAIQATLGLFWVAKILSQAQQATVFLSPNQFVIRCESGPLLREIQKILSWHGKEILTSGWREELRRHMGPDTVINNRRGWRYYHCCERGIHVTDLGLITPFASRFLIGVRTEEGFWAQTFTEGMPDTPPLLISQSSSVGLLLGAALTDEWFKLPLVEEEIRNSLYFPLNASGWRKVPPGRGLSALGFDWEQVVRRRKIFFPNTEVKWQEGDSLIAASPNSPEEIVRWL